MENIENLKAEIAALESQKTELKNVICQKEKEIKSAQSELGTCDINIRKLQKRLLEFAGKVEEDANAFKRVFTIGGVSFKLIRVGMGTFLMGSSDSDPNGDSDEKPQHQVTLGDFYIGETLVTQSLWKAVSGNFPFYFKGDDLPVDNVSWDDCQAFIKKLNIETGLTFRLPTEAEWEYAARGGRESKDCKYAGSNIIGDVAWYNDNSGEATHKVKDKKPNELGLYDMSGNVLEWCQDLYDSDYYKKSPSSNPCNTSWGADRVLRGGSWSIGEGSCRVYNRFSDRQNHRSPISGFRLVLAL